MCRLAPNSAIRRDRVETHRGLSRLESCGSCVWAGVDSGFRSAMVLKVSTSGRMVRCIWPACFPMASRQRKKASAPACEPRQLWRQACDLRRWLPHRLDCRKFSAVTISICVICGSGDGAARCCRSRRAGWSGRSVFQTASGDGSKVFFTDEAQADEGRHEHSRASLISICVKLAKRRISRRAR